MCNVLCRVTVLYWCFLVIFVSVHMQKNKDIWFVARFCSNLAIVYLFVSDVSVL